MAMAPKEVQRVKKSRRKSRSRTILPETLIASRRDIRLLPHVDNRSPWAKEWLEIQRNLYTDRGGIELTSEAERLLIANAAVLAVELKLQAAKLCAIEEGGAERPLIVFAQLTGALRRTLETLGTSRAPRTVDNILPPEDKPDPIKQEVARRAMLESSDPMLLALFRDSQQAQQAEANEPPIYVVFEGEKK
jgi:hypothetical protein